MYNMVLICCHFKKYPSSVDEISSSDNESGDSEEIDENSELALSRLDLGPGHEFGD